MVQFIFSLSNVPVFDKAHLWQSVTLLASMRCFSSVSIVLLHRYEFYHIYKHIQDTL